LAKFLSDEWFAKIEELINGAGELDIPKAMGDVVVNLAIHSGGGQVDMCINRGVIQRGHVRGADVEMSMPDDYALKILVQGDWSAGMKGWVGRKIKVTGNMRKLIPLQVFKPTGAQERLRKKIEEITEA
jgi:hypothetical protein